MYQGAMSENSMMELPRRRRARPAGSARCTLQLSENGFGCFFSECVMRRHGGYEPILGTSTHAFQDLPLGDAAALSFGNIRRGSRSIELTAGVFGRPVYRLQEWC